MRPTEPAGRVPRLLGPKGKIRLRPLVADTKLPDVAQFWKGKAMHRQRTGLRPIGSRRTIDITDMTDSALDVVLAARSGAEYVDCEHLTPKERYQVAEALGWEMNARTIAWISGPSENAPGGPRFTTFDYEGAILDEQEDFYS